MGYSENLIFVEPSPVARRLLWHLYSIGTRRLLEEDRHERFEKPGAHLFWVKSGQGELEYRGRHFRLRRGKEVWLVDMNSPRAYIPAPGHHLTFAGFRFGGPGLEFWHEEMRDHENAEFTLAIDPSDLGFATLVPDSTFLVYGLTDEAGDTWDETTLTARNAPAHDPASAARNLPVPDKTRLLGSFTIAQGVNRGNCTLRGPALVDFLNADTNGIVTFILCRETDETARSGLVHAFATKESGSNTPPLLRVKPRG